MKLTIKNGTVFKGLVLNINDLHIEVRIEDQVRVYVERDHGPSIDREELFSFAVGGNGNYEVDTTDQTLAAVRNRLAQMQDASDHLGIVRYPSTLARFDEAVKQATGKAVAKPMVKNRTEALALLRAIQLAADASTVSARPSLMEHEKDAVENIGMRLAQGMNNGEYDS